MNTVFCADGHVDHLASCKRRGFETVEKFQEYYADTWCSKVGKNTLVYCVGDMALYHSGLVFMKKLPGRKILVMGNHDPERENNTRDLIEVYDELYGVWKHKGSPLYIAHVPSHPSQLRGRLMVHGHLHGDVIQDERYINVSWEQLPGHAPVSIEDIVSGKFRTWRKPEHGTIHLPSKQV